MRPLVVLPSQKIEVQEQSLVDLYRRADPEVAPLAFLWGAYEPKCAQFRCTCCVFYYRSIRVD